MESSVGNELSRNHFANCISCVFGDIYIKGPTFVLLMVHINPNDQQIVPKPYITKNLGSK